MKKAAAILAVLNINSKKPRFFYLDKRGSKFVKKIHREHQNPMLKQHCYSVIVRDGSYLQRLKEKRRDIF